MDQKWTEAELLRLLDSTLDAGPDLPYPSVVPSALKNAGQNSPAKVGNLPFEEALKKLETIVAAMETEDLPLEALLAKYEEGTRLARTCQEKLTEAELKIRQLEKTASGELQLKPVAPPEGADE
jgi:exodeoxyribonuclease VII small subunit